MYYSSKLNEPLPSPSKPRDMFKERASAMVHKAVDEEFDFFCNGDNDYFVDDTIPLNVVHRVMEFLQWRWVTSKTTNRIPSKEEIQNEVKRLCDDVYETAARCGFKDNDYYVSCGGFTVSLYLEDMDKKCAEEYNEGNKYDMYIECNISFNVI